MIINCINCNKKFMINSDLIPENGRLLQCGSCNHKWHYTRVIANDTTVNLDNKNPDNIGSTKKNFDTDTSLITETIVKPEKEILVKKVSKKISFLNFLFVFLITFIAILIVIDTFQPQLILLFPEIEFLIYHFYETTNDIILFMKDLL
jgi:predicted Zn finger-like uncharacterized protein